MVEAILSAAWHYLSCFAVGWLVGTALAHLVHKWQEGRKHKQEL